MSAIASLRPMDTADVLEEMEVTDRLFHDLRWTMPLVTSMVSTLRRVKPSGRVLAIAPNALLERSLTAAGYDVEVWHHELSLPDPISRALITRRGPFEALLSDVEGGPYDAVVSAYVLDRAVDHPISILARLRGIVRRDGVVVIAHKLPGGLHARREAIAGRAMPPDPVSRPDPLNYAWVPVPVRRQFAASDLGVWASRSGFAIAKHEAVVDRNAINPIVPMGLRAWLRANISHAAQRLVPPLRESGVAVLVTQPGPFESFADGLDFPFVSVLVSSAPVDRLPSCLDSLAEMVYPAHRLEVLVAGSGHLANSQGHSARVATRVIDVGAARGLDVMRVLMAQARGDILAITDGYCRVPRRWIDAALNQLTEWSPGVCGPVWPDSGSAEPFLTLPGQRPEVASNGWLSAGNLICRKAVLAEALKGEDDGPADGWESELGCRFDDLGASLGFEEQARVARLFPFPDRRGWLDVEFEKAKLIPALVRRRPVLRSGLEFGLFASRRTLAFDVLLIGLVATAITRNWWLLLVGLLWLASCRRHIFLWPPGQWPTSFRHLRGMYLRSVVWFIGLAVGSFQARRLVL